MAAQSIPALLRAHGLRPRKGLGQNFLVDPVAQARIVEAADLSPDDAVVEVGAGLGSLTQLLAARAGQVVAVELDDALAQILRQQVAGLPNVQVVQGDVLRMADFGFSHLGYKMVGNLPYYITSAVLRHFLAESPRPRLVVVTVQREVAERIVARPGDMSLLAVSIQLYGEPEIVARIPAGAFYPSPQVDSAVVRVAVGEKLAVDLGEGVTEQEFFRAVRAGFGQKRKTLRNSLKAGLALPAAEVEAALERAGVNPSRRAETLSLQEWAAVTNAVHKRKEYPQQDSNLRPTA
ncbi:MAG: ribosomal RNA small subunit methyltransferase A [Anaerolineaceae bacterium]|nr:ribosomal RNA small subunit methyltransferase A [Anaerolineaceae bacterium]